MKNFGKIEILNIWQLNIFAEKTHQNDSVLNRSLKKMKFSRQCLGWSKSLWLLQRVAFLVRIDAATFEVNTTNHISQKSFNDNWRCYPWFYAPLQKQTLFRHKYMGEKYIYILSPKMWLTNALFIDHFIKHYQSSDIINKFQKDLKTSTH